jgi:hypothetical protein
MFLYNITVGIDKDIESEWIQWMKKDHIPAVLSTKLFFDHKFYKVLHDQDDGNVSYSVQYFSHSLEEVMNFFENFSPAIMHRLQTRYKDKHVAFMTLLEEVG